MNLKMNRRLSPIIALLLTPVVFAEKFPLSLDELQTEADAIVMAHIEHIRIESESSRFERAFGNADWGIYLTLRVETVEKGKLSETQLEARCFRIKYRTSCMRYLTPSGHYPIPGTGTRVRAFLEMESGSWNVVLPNGLIPPDANEYSAHWSSYTNRSGPNCPDAAEITALRSRGYTYVLPLEIWVLIFVAIGLYKLAVALVRWFVTRNGASTEE